MAWMPVQKGVDAFEEPFSRHERFTYAELLGRSAEYFYCPLHPLVFHQLLEGCGGQDAACRYQIVAAAMAGGQRCHWTVLCSVLVLRKAGQGVIFGAECQYRFSFAPLGDEGGRHPGYIPGHFKTVFFEVSGQLV